MLIHYVRSNVCRRLACVQGNAWRARQSHAVWPQVTQLVGFQPPGMGMEAHVQMQQLQVCASPWQLFDCGNIWDQCIACQLCIGCCTRGISTP